ncbi:glycosyltransferase [Zoogloeaceae bacterium G21618-S1]|nr:glycosyltransferase [Zoogloeaceae bacterium G21618-S1]
MRILFCTTRGYLPQCVGGSEWSTHMLCQGLSRKGHPVAVLSDLHNNGLLALRNRITRKLTGNPFPVDHAMGYPVYRGWGSTLGITAIADRFRPDVIVVVGTAPGPVDLALSAIKTGIPVAYQLRDVEFHLHGDRFLELPNVRFIANSDFTANRFREYCDLPAEVVLPPVEPEKCRVNQPGNSVLMINPDPKKGGEIAVTLAEHRPDIPFIFQESWQDNARLNALKARAMSCSNIKWRSPVMDIRRAFADTRLLLAPSQWAEAWGRVATEAQVSGIPVLASAIGGLSQAVGPGGILLAPNAGIEAWLAALDSIWYDDDHWHALSTQAREYAARDEIQPERQIDKMISILEDCIRCRIDHPKPEHLRSRQS